MMKSQRRRGCLFAGSRHRDRDRKPSMLGEVKRLQQAQDALLVYCWNSEVHLHCSFRNPYPILTHSSLQGKGNWTQIATFSEFSTLGLYLVRRISAGKTAELVGIRKGDCRRLLARKGIPLFRL